MPPREPPKLARTWSDETRTRRIFIVAGLVLGLAACPSIEPPAGGLCVEIAPAVPLVSAHRGGAAYAPEDTLLAFQNAVRLGVDELEMDTQLTSDNQLVIIHDDSLDRTTNCAGDVISMTLAQVQACDAAHWFSPGQPTTVVSMDAPHPLRGAGVKVPALREVLDWYQTLTCNPPRLSIEIKNVLLESNFDPVGDKIARVLLPLLAEYGLEEQIVIQSFWPVTLIQVKLLNPRLKTQFLTASSFATTAVVNLAFIVATGHDISAPNFDAPDFDASFVELAHAVGKAVIPYTVDTAADQRAVVDFGVDGLITNFPGCLLQTLGRATPAKMTPDGTPDTPACPAP
ncbi:MAG: glycerophosphodiester phosphodiesterase [Nevskiales bacterium]